MEIKSHKTKKKCLENKKQNLYQTSMEILIIFTVTTATIVNMLTDIQYRIIRNEICILIAVLFIPYALLSIESSEYLIRLMVAGIAFCFGYFFWTKSWVGAGDVKYLSSILLWVPSDLVSGFFALMAASSLLVTLFIIAKFFLRKEQEKPTIPYAVPITLSYLSILIKQLYF